MKGNALFFSISGVAAARTWPLYRGVEALLSKQVPDKKIAFLGNPFAPREGHRRFPLPLLWSDEERGWHPTTRVLNCWKRLNEFGVTKLRPALSEHDIVITERLGFDGVMYATSCCDDDAAIDEAERIHHALVRMRIVEQGIKPPLYFIPLASVDDVGNLRRHFPELWGTDENVLRDFLAHEARVLDRYFDPRHGQNRPHLLPASMTIEAMAEEVVAAIGEQVRLREAA